MGIVGEAVELDDPFAEVGEADGERVLGGELRGQGQRDVFGVVPGQRVFPLSAVRTAASIITSARRAVVWFSSSMCARMRS